MKTIIQIIISILIITNSITLAYSVIPDSERQALIDLYNSTGGDNWDKNTGWLGEAGTKCSWYGVTCDSEKAHVLKLELRGNDLTGAIPQTIGNLTNLTVLDLARNNLRSVPVEIGNLTNLTTLDLSRNDLTSVPVEIGNLTNLTTLDLSRNDLTSVPVEIGNLTNLTTLDLSYNDLTSVPAEIGDLSKLTTLYLSVNKLTSLPAEIGNLTNLTTLGLSYNDLTSMPAEIGDLSKLTTLYLYGNKLTSLPAEIGNLTNLTNLWLDWDKLTSIPAEFCNLVKFTSLSLSRENLYKLPIGFGNLTNLKKLTLNYTFLTSLPAEFGKLKNLTTLELYANKLKSLPAEFGNLANLTNLDLSGNDLTSLPAEFGNLTNLTNLDLSGNDLTSLPAEFGSLTKLTNLSLWSNDLTSLPARFGNLTNLTRLDLANNDLKNFPAEIVNLTNVTSLFLSGNKITNLSSEITNLTKLDQVNFRYNALEISDLETISFLNTKQKDWQKTQTISPKHLTITTKTDNSISLSWSSIEYTGHEGGYEIYYSASDNQSYTMYHMTTNKTIAHMTISGLLSDTIYYFKIRTITYPHPSEQWYGRNLHTVYSQFTTEISTKTLPLIATAKQSLSGVLNSSNINIDITGHSVDFYQFKLNHNPWSEDFSIDTPITFNSLEDGSYTLQIMGKNNIGSSQKSPSVYTWRVDTQVDNFSINKSDWIDDSICLWALEPKNMAFSGTREIQSSIFIDTIFANDIIISYPDKQTWKVQLTNMPSGSYTILFQSNDIAGNKAKIEKSIHVLVPESALIETQTDSLLADNTQTLSMMISFYSEDQGQICVDPDVRLESTLGEIIEESWLISNNQLTCLLKADTKTGTAHISTFFENKELGSTTIEMTSGPFNRIVLYSDNPVQEVGIRSDLISLQLEDAYGHPVSVPYDMDISIESTANVNGDFYFKGNDGWGWQNEFFVYSLKADEPSFKFWFKSTISGNYILNATSLEYDLTANLAITVLDQVDIQFQTVSSETSELSQSAAVALKLNRITDQDVWVKYLTETAAETNATEGSDYALASEQKVTIPAGEMTGFIPLTIINDDIYESSENIIIKLNSASISIGSKNTHTLRINDDEPPPSPPTISGPISPTHMKSPRFCWASGGGSQTFRYKIDDPDLSLGAVETKSKCYELSYELAEGDHVFYVQEYNAPTNEWSVSGSYSIKIDTGHPCSESQSPPAVDAQHMQFEITYTVADIYSGEMCGNPQYTGSGVKHVELWGMGPEDDAYTLITTDTDDYIDGKFEFLATNEGPYRFFTRAIDQAGNPESELNQEYDTQTIYSKDFSGYAILAVGAIDGQKGLASHTFSANKVYRHLVSRKFGMLYDLKDPLDHIKYFNPHKTELSGVDPFENNQKYLEALEFAITEWAMDHICRIPGPLYIILIDHGGTDKFYLTGNNDWLEASKLNNWINTLEEGVQNCTDAPKQDIIIIIDTCNAGSFMNDLIKPKSTRIVITSTAENEPSFRGPKSPSTDLLVRDGAFFASNLFNELSKGINLAQSFEIAVQRTEILSFSDTIRPKYPFVDHAEQHPLLNDNGISSGYNELYSSGNGYRAKGIKLGYGQNATEGPEIIEINIQPDRPLHVNESLFDISLRIKNPDDDLKVFFEIRAPDSQRPETINEQLQKELNLQQIPLNKVSEGFYQKRCNEFQVAGKYTLFFYVQDADGILYYANQAYVYKTKANNSPPAHFQLMYPMSLDDPENQGSTEKVPNPVYFQWEDTADKDPFTYSLWISKSRQFDTDLIKVEDWIDSQYKMEFSESWDGCTVYWKVEAIDEFGALTETEIYRFQLNEINDPDDMSMVYFQVYNSQTQFPVPGAKIWFEQADPKRPMITSKRGILIQQLDLSNTVDITISAPTYETAYTQITDKDSPTLSLAIPLVSNVQTGDINRDGTIDMGDAILALQILSDIQDSKYFYEQAALIDNNVGLADIIYVLRWISGFVD